MPRPRRDPRGERGDIESIRHREGPQIMNRLIAFLFVWAAAFQGMTAESSRGGADFRSDVVKAFEDAPADGQHVIEFYPEKNFECLDRAETRAANAEILKAYGIAKDRRL